MQKVIVFFTLMAIAVAKDGGVFDKIDPKSILNDKIKMKELFACLMDLGPCGDMQELRDSLPLLIQTNCGTCTPRQKESFETTIKNISDRYPEEFKKLASKYSPKSD